MGGAGHAGTPLCLVLRLYDSPAVARLLTEDFGDPFSERLGDVVFYRELIAHHGATSLLELGCGFGRVAVALAPSVARAVGVDDSALMIGLAEMRARERGVSAPQFDFRVADACGLPDLGRFDLILAPFRVFECLLTPEEVAGFLRSCRRAAHAGSRVVLHVVEMPEPDPTTVEAESIAPPRTRPGEDGLHLRSLRYDGATRVVTESWWVADGSTGAEPETATFAWRWSTAAEIAEACRGHGFDVSRREAPFGADAPGRHWLVELTPRA